jgi:hypothetical protein
MLLGASAVENRSARFAVLVGATVLGGIATIKHMVEGQKKRRDMTRAHEAEMAAIMEDIRAGKDLPITPEEDPK